MVGTCCFLPPKNRPTSHKYCTLESVWWVSRILYEEVLPTTLHIKCIPGFSFCLCMKQVLSFSGRDTAWSALPGFERSLNSSCQSEACISCFRFFPGDFDVNPFHTSNTSVLLQAFLSFLSIQIYMGVGELWAVIVQLLKRDSNDKAHSISPHSDWVLTTQDIVCQFQFF